MLCGTIAVKNKQWNISIATNPWELTQGLGGLSDMPAQSGMLFDLGMPQTIQVTTVPMLFPLDIAFFSETLEVTEIYRNVQPGYLVTSTIPVRYFLEVNTGELEGIVARDMGEVNIQSAQETTIAPDWTGAVISFMGFLVVSIFTVGLVKTLVKGLFEEPPKQPKLLPRVTLPVRNAVPPGGTTAIGTNARNGEHAVWIRYGDVSDYFDFNSPYDAGQGVGMILAEYPTQPFSYHYISAGVEVEPYYTRQNYISLFWGDQDAQWVRDLTKEEKKAFERGIKNSLDFQPSTLPKKDSQSLSVALLLEKWRTAKARNSALALRDLETLSPDYDTADCKQALLDYQGIERSDYGDREEYQEAREETWEAFRECLESLAGEEEEMVNIKSRPAVVPVKGEHSKEPGLNYLTDSPEYLTQTIEDIGYREKIDNAFLDAIARARSER